MSLGQLKGEEMNDVDKYLGLMLNVNRGKEVEMKYSLQEGNRSSVPLKNLW